ncbi:hypothetical protein [Bradyrhizobium icense]|uniref:Uncharacterized protein n=1 Tax=Bradyrhizobium icense TaxID=1274631 RepID=A0A1B1UIY4_9BRAD|nr:hypothetical protein [Bradyrhizobium icense]ANW02734.1 hypothetical protein LMTR13_23780 [Bradyrhizobium icense]
MSNIRRDDETGYVGLALTTENKDPKGLKRFGDFVNCEAVAIGLGGALVPNKAESVRPLAL